jgi:hypothetical protein
MLLGRKELPCNARAAEDLEAEVVLPERRHPTGQHEGRAEEVPVLVDVLRSLITT